MKHLNDTREGNGSLKVTTNNDSVSSVGVETEVRTSKTIDNSAFAANKEYQRRQNNDDKIWLVNFTQNLMLSKGYGP